MARPTTPGLGFYAYMRFHVDSMKYRRWNMDPAVAAECPPIVHPGDAASIGQPLPPLAPVQAPDLRPSSHRLLSSSRKRRRQNLDLMPCVAGMQHHIEPKK